MNIVLLMMAGSGVRFGADIPKQFIEVEGKPIFSYILEGYERCKYIDKIIVVTHKNWIDFVEQWNKKMHLSKVEQIVSGGDTRSESIKNGLFAMKNMADAEDVILIHDATHPYVDEVGTLQVIEAVKKYGGATLGQCQYDTVYQMDEETHMLEKVIPRQKIVSGASPEAFQYRDIYGIYENSSKEELEAMTSAGAMALQYGIKMKVVPANCLNLKITYKNDMEVLKKILHYYFQDDNA